MAQDINRILDSLSDYSADIIKISGSKDLVAVIEKLEDLADQSTLFGGEISRVLPTKIRQVADSLRSLYSQMQTSAKTAESELTKLIDFVDTIPVGQLRKKSGISSTSVNTAPVGATAGTSDELSSGAAPKSAMLQQESSVWNAVKTRFREQNTRNNNVFNFHKICENVDSLNIDFGIIDPNEGKNPTSLFESIAQNLPKGAGDLNTRPGPRDLEEEYDDYTVDDESNVNLIKESMQTSSPSVVAPLSTFNFRDIPAANIDFDNLELNESDSDITVVPDAFEESGPRKPSKLGRMTETKNYDLSEKELNSRIVG